MDLAVPRGKQLLVSSRIDRRLQAYWSLVVYDQVSD
jgi:hypothetical protein